MENSIELSHGDLKVRTKGWNKRYKNLGFWSWARIVLLKKQHNTCFYCDTPFSVCGKPEFEHVVPSSKGGPTVIENIVLACRGCNAIKGDKTYGDGSKEQTRVAVRRIIRRCYSKVCLVPEGVSEDKVVEEVLHNTMPDEGVESTEEDRDRVIQMPESGKAADDTINKLINKYCA